MGHQCKKNKRTGDLIDHYWRSISYISTLIKASELKVENQHLPMF